MAPKSEVFSDLFVKSSAIHRQKREEIKTHIHTRVAILLPLKVVSNFWIPYPFTFRMKIANSAKRQFEGVWEGK